jgi:hypothetical protein
MHNGKKELNKKYKVNVGRMFRVRNVKNFWFSNSSKSTYNANYLVQKSVDVFGENLLTMVIDETNSKVAAYVEPYGKIWLSKHFLLKEFSAIGAAHSSTDSVRELASDISELYQTLLIKQDSDNAGTAKNILQKAVALIDTIESEYEKEVKTK